MSLQQLKHFAPALLILIASSGLVPGSAAAATSVPSPTHDVDHPAVMQRAASYVATAKTGSLQPFTPQPKLPAVGGAGGPLREIFGFALASSLNDPTVGYPTWDFSLLTVVAFFGLHVQDDGTFAADSGSAVWNSSELSGLIAAAHPHGTKVVLTIILQDFAAGTPHMCAGLANRATTISQTIGQVSAKGVDGVNIDYEGLNGTCPNGQTARSMMTSFVQQLRSALPGGSQLSVDTYASSATDPLGFFDIAGMAPYADFFFVMAYDLEYSNYKRPPLSCSSFCLGPTAPVAGYYYNDTGTASQYTAVVPASKVVLGVPYYGRKACVSSATPNQYPAPPTSVVADSYLDASGESTSSMVQPGSYVTHRDANDPAGPERWDTWFNTTLNCTRELYWDDVTSLGQKYGLINQDNLRGVGLWNLNYGGGAPELWSLLSTYFACVVNVAPPAPPVTTEFTVSLSAGKCAVASYDIQQYDSTLNTGWYPLIATVPAGGNATAVAEGLPGYAYQFRARAHSTAGFVGGWSTASTTVATTATWTHAYKGLYTLDAYGGISANSSPPLIDSASWPGWKIARAAQALPGATPQSGAVLDGYGGLHSYGAPITLTLSAYWPGWEIARDFAFLPDGSGGYVLDGYGGLHPFAVNGHALPAAVRTTAYWPGWDIARKLGIFSDGTGGYVMDGYGGLHPFGIGAAPPAPATGAAYWPGWQIARAVVLIPGSHAGYVLDGYGGLHSFSGAPALSSGAYWPGWDIARSIWLLAGSTMAAPSGYLLDGFGGVHPFGGASALTSHPYWPGLDIARNLTGF
jgi:spore germination protein YaaH